MTPEDPADTDECAFLGGRLRLRQFRRGHHAGTDAILLAAATRIEPGEHLVDVGAGIGAAALAVLCRVPDVQATLLEVDAATAELARNNIALNGFGARARVVELDIFDEHNRDALRDCRADVAISNPPFYRAGAVRESTLSRKRTAHVLTHNTHAEWIRQVAATLRPRGRLVVIHRPEALAELLAGLPATAGRIRLRGIHPTDRRPAIRLIVSAQLASREPLAIDAALMLHGADGAFTAEVDALSRGIARL